MLSRRKFIGFNEDLVSPASTQVRTFIRSPPNSPPRSSLQSKLPRSTSFLSSSHRHMLSPRLRQTDLDRQFTSTLFASSHETARQHAQPFYDPTNAESCPDFCSIVSNSLCAYVFPVQYMSMTHFSRSNASTQRSTDAKRLFEILLNKLVTSVDEIEQ